MKITPLEIRQHEFEKTFRGYNIEEVDSFLANISQEWERVLNESKMLRMQLEIAEKEANKLREIEMTLFKTLKTAEDTSTMITEQASQQADKHIYEAKLLGDKSLIEAQQKADDIIRQAEDRAKYIKDEVLGDVKILERDFRAMDHYKTNLLVQMRSLSNATLEHVQRFEDKFDKEGVDAKFKEATSMLVEEEEVSITVNDVITPIVEPVIPSIVEVIEVAEPIVEEEVIADIPSITPEIAEVFVEDTIIAQISVIEPSIIEQVIEEKAEIIITEPIVTTTILSSSVNNFAERTPVAEQVLVRKSETPKEDELEIIEGIGPKIAMLLYDSGIFTFRDLATTPVYKIQEILEQAGPQFARHDPSTWTQQAKLAAEGRWDDLEALKFYLVGGRKPKKEEVDVITPVAEVYVAPVIVAPVVAEVYVAPVIVAPAVAEVYVAPVIAAPAVAEVYVAPVVVQEMALPVVEAIKETVGPTPAPVENNLDSITEEMLEKVNKVKAAIRKAMVEKNDAPTKDTTPLPTLNDIIAKNEGNTGGGSFFDNI